MRHRNYYVIGITTCLAVVLQTSCSKKEEPNLGTAKEQPAQAERVVTPSEGNVQPPVREAVRSKPRVSEPSWASAPERPVAAGPVQEAKPGSLAEVAQNLKSTGDRDAAYAAIKEYASKNPGSLAEMAAFLRSGDADFALLGARGLAALATPEAAAELIAAIQATTDARTRRELCGALSEFNSPASAELFLNFLGSSDDREITTALQRALGNSSNVEVLSEVLKRYHASNSATERDNLIAAIRQMQNPDIVEGLLAILNEQKVVSSTEPLSLAVADTLGIIGTPLAVSNLFQHLASLREGASSPVYDSIGRVSNPDTLPLLASVAYGQVAGMSLYARMAAVQALGNYSSELVSPALNWLMQNDPNSSIREAARGALQRVNGN